MIDEGSYHLTHLNDPNLECKRTISRGGPRLMNFRRRRRCIILTQSHNWNSQFTTYDIVTFCRLRVTYQYVEHTHYQRGAENLSMGGLDLRFTLISCCKDMKSEVTFLLSCTIAGQVDQGG
jgi:hypothetical protein